MPQDVALWAIGLLCSFIGALLLIILSRVLKQGDDTNAKVTSHSSTLSTIARDVSTLDDRVTDLHAWKNKQQERELTAANAEILELRRRQASDLRTDLREGA